MTDAGIYYDKCGNELKSFVLKMQQVFRDTKGWYRNYGANRLRMCCNYSTDKRNECKASLSEC